MRLEKRPSQPGVFPSHAGFLAVIATMVVFGGALFAVLGKDPLACDA